jgi:hypothetical protein
MSSLIRSVPSIVHRVRPGEARSMRNALGFKQIHFLPACPWGAPRRHERQSPCRAAAESPVRSPPAACPGVLSLAEKPSRTPNNPEAPTLPARSARGSWFSICGQSHPVQTGVRSAAFDGPRAWDRLDNLPRISRLTRLPSLGVKSRRSFLWNEAAHSALDVCMERQ